MLSNCFVSVLDVSSNVAFACRNKKRERKVRSIRTISNWKRFDRARQRTKWPPPRENISFCLDTTIHERPFKFKFIYIQSWPIRTQNDSATRKICIDSVCFCCGTPRFKIMDRTHWPKFEFTFPAVLSTLYFGEQWIFDGKVYWWWSKIEIFRV